MLREPRSITEFTRNTTNTSTNPPLLRLKAKQALRVLAIHRSIQTRGALPNCKRLARLFSIHRRTIHRDIQMMRESLGLPLEYDESNLSYYYSSQDLPFDLDRHRKLRAGFAALHPDVMWLLAHIRHH